MDNSELEHPAVVAFVGAVLLGSCLAWAWLVVRLWLGRPPLARSKDTVRAVPWRVGSILAVILLYLAVNAMGLMLLVSYLKAKGIPFKAFQENAAAFGREQLLLMAFINSAMLVLTPLLLVLIARARLADLGLRPGWKTNLVNAWRGAVAALLVSPGVYAVFAASQTIWKPQHHPLERMLRDDHSPFLISLVALCAVILGPAAEELLFRGVLQGWLTRVWARKVRPVAPLAEPSLDLIESTDVEALSSQDPETASFDSPSPEQVDLPESLWPIVMTSVVFAAVHLPQWPSPVAIFPLSLALGLLYQKTGNLIAPFVLHACFNGISTMALILSFV